jgi:UDP-N-acetylmuramoyl-tripeptide--D-alanyl-D-alanine ligase
MKNIAKKIITFILQAEASLVLRKYNPKIIAVIGSVGKTSTKDAIYSVFSREFFARKSDKSFNSDVGIPLTVLGCRNGWNNPLIWIQNIWSGFLLLIRKEKYPEWLILEIGVDQPGDMKRASSWIKPDILVVTRFAEIPVHVEHFSSPEAVIAEKSLMVSALKKDGVLVLNADDEKVLALKSKWNGKTKTYGINEKADVMGSHLSVMYEEDEIERKFPNGTILRLNVGDTSVPARLYGTLGKAVGYSAIATTAVALSAGINLVKISEGLAEIVPPAGRMRLLRGIKSTLIIDDSYNASPVAMKSALETLKEITTYGRKVAVLGDMLELGKYSTDEHKKIGILAKNVCNVLVTVGMRARTIAGSALDNGMDENNIYQFDTSKEAGKYLEKLIGDGDIVLIKGSQGSGVNKIRMEQAVEEIMAEPEKASELLVRQSEEWKTR